MILRKGGAGRREGVRERGSHGERSCQSLGDFKRTAAL